MFPSGVFIETLHSPLSAPAAFKCACSLVRCPLIRQSLHACQPNGVSLGLHISKARHSCNTSSCGHWNCSCLCFAKRVRLFFKIIFAGGNVCCRLRTHFLPLICPFSVCLSCWVMAEREIFVTSITVLCGCVLPSGGPNILVWSDLLLSLDFYFDKYNWWKQRYVNTTAITNTRLTATTITTTTTT